MGNLQSSPSSSNTTLEKKYDVFVNFRGEDTRDCFTSHLDEALCRNQIKAFIDYQLRVGDEILPSLMGAINESKISVVIFSERYATSKWCLRELVEILKCKKVNDQIVIPVFYRVEPTDVRNQTASFKASFVDHEKEFHEEAIKWRQALAEACGIKGLHSSNGRTDATLVKEIVKDIWEKLMSEYIPPDFGGLIGLKPRIEQIISSLCLHVTTDVRIIGIWGMGGIGKTTLAKAIFNQNSNQFEGVCFIENVRERLEKCGGLDSVRKEILSEVLKDRDLKLDGPTIPPKIKERLNRLKVFIVLDDVHDFLKIETLIEGVDGSGQGSRIIITSRDKQVLRNCCENDDNIYEVEGLNCHEALQLFCKYAFRKNCHNEDLDLMVNQLVNFTNGNPLALKVLGSLLYKKSKEEWESVVNKFEPTNLSRKIFDVLKISYNGLLDIEKDIFLDIACFLKGKTRDYAASILDDRYYYLRVLADRSLITMSSYDTIEMHDLLVEMGRDIVHLKSPSELGKRCRLWRPEDVICTLTNDDGTPEVQGILLDMIKINKDMDLGPQVFKKMYNLRILKFYDSTYHYHSKANCWKDLSDHFDNLRSHIWFGLPLQAPFYNSTYSNYSEVVFSESPSVLFDELRSLISYKYHLRVPSYNSTYSDYSKVNFSEGLSVLSDKLRSLIWYGYPLQSLPSNFNPNNLVELDLRGSNLDRLWEDCMCTPKLRWLNLSGCTRVTKIPDLSKSPLLETIDLQDCRSLLDFPRLQHLKYLAFLYSRGCTSLMSFPSDIHFESLTSLDLSNCNNLTKFPQISGNIISLDLSGTAIKELHHSIAHLNGLEELFLGRCENLETFPSGICNLTSLRHLDLSDCSRLEILPENLGNLKSLEYLSVERAAIKELPHSIVHLYELVELYLGGCENLETLPSGIRNLTSLQRLDLSDCSRLEILLENLGNFRYLKYLSADRIAICQQPYSMKSLSCSLTILFLRDCNLNYIPKDIGCLSSLVELDLSVNNFDGLPQSMMELWSLKFLHLDNCNGIVSLIDLPPLTHLSACDCKQLQSIPNELRLPRESIFTNCMEFEETAVGNMLARLVKYRNQYSDFILCYPGSKVPKWFKGYPTEGSSISKWFKGYPAKGSSIKFQETFDCNLQGFAVCAVIAFEKYLFNGDSQHKFGVHFHGTCSDGDQRSPTEIMSQTAYFTSRNRTLIDSDHVAFGYSYVNRRFKSYGDLGTRFKNYSFEFQFSVWSPNYKLKSCGVCPIYVQDYDADDIDRLAQVAVVRGLMGRKSNYYHLFQPSGKQSNDHLEEEVEPHPKENKNLQTVKYAEPIENIGETSGIRRSRTSNDHLEEEVEAHPKRLNIWFTIVGLLFIHHICRGLSYLPVNF